MSKKRRWKKDKKLRREVEILRAQLKTENIKKEKVIPGSNKNLAQDAGKTEAEAPASLKTNDQLIKKDLIKTLIISSFAFATIIGIKIYLGT